MTEVRIGPDLKHAIAFVSRLGRTDVDALLPALKRAAPYLRGQVAHALRLKFAPDLTFQPDHALEYARRSTGCCTGRKWHGISAELQIGRRALRDHQIAALHRH